MTSGASLLFRYTFNDRRFSTNSGWTPEPIWAARLGLGDTAADLLVTSTRKFRLFASGLTACIGDKTNTFYTEWNGILTSAINEMLLQSYDGAIRVYSAMPKTRSWNDSKFTLRAQNGFMVTSEMAENTVNI